MARTRHRFAVEILLLNAKAWPVIGLVGPRQSGKTTLLTTLLGLDEVASMDELEVREEAIRSPKSFLSKRSRPLVIDEAQKAPPLFDEIKHMVDRKRIPGRFYLTGSSTFSSKDFARESLTGRIATTEFQPMTLAELYSKSFRPIDLEHPVGQKPRFGIGEVSKAIISGGMPVPAFFRNADQRENYWNYWLDTTVERDLGRVYGRNYDPDISWRILQRVGSILKEGELPSLKHFDLDARKLRKYLGAMCAIFMFRRISSHELGASKEVWIPMDAGLVAHLMKTTDGEVPTLSLVRAFLWNEWMAQLSYQGKRALRSHYQSGQGGFVDAIWEGIPFRVVSSVTSVTRRLSWEERPLRGAMKKLGSRTGYLVGPIERPVPPEENSGVGILPWGAWS